MLVELDQMVTRMVFDIYGVERLYDSHKASTTYQLRCIEYQIQAIQQTDKSDVRLFPHTDKGFTSILHQNEVNGLQIKTRAGQWIDYAPSSPSSFIVFAAEVLMVRGSLSHII